jgi:hypothetical protein
MALDSIRPNEGPAVAETPPARVASVRTRPEKPAVASVQPIPLPPPEPRDEVNIKWDRSDGVIVTFTDKKSGNIVRQIPSEQVLSVARFIRQLLEESGSSKLAQGQPDSEGAG